MRKAIFPLFTALGLLLLPAFAQQVAPIPELKGENLQQTQRKPLPKKPTVMQSLGDKMNANTVTIISGGVTGSFITIANDISFTLDDEDKMRILPIIGKGAQQNLVDILLLRGIDIGIVRSDGLEALKNDKRFPGGAAQITYITRLFTDEAHLLVSKEITDIKQLAGKKVSFDLNGSGANYSGRLLFERLGIAVIAENMDNNLAYEKLKTGELAGVFQWASKPISAVSKFEGNGKFHLLDIPYDQKIAELYSPAALDAKDYPRLVGEKGATTLAASSILAVYNWPKDSERYARVAKFVDVFFSKIDEFHKPGRHPKWQEVNINATVPGWTRFKPAQEWLEKNNPQNTQGKPDFMKFMAQRGGVAPQTKADMDRLFVEFTAWQKKQAGQ